MILIQSPSIQMRELIMSSLTNTNGTIVDLFSGCGGFSLGAHLAGFKSLAAIDVEPILQSGYKRNFPSSRAIQASVADINASDWQHILKSKRPDGVLGGPPCQGFSWMGHRNALDPRNSLLDQFYRHVSLLQPSFFVMENVQGLLDTDKVHLLNSALNRVADRYEILEPLIVNARDYGAPTERKRVVIIGFDPQKMNPVTSNDIIQFMVPEKVTVRDAIADLPSPIYENNEPNDLTWANYPTIPNKKLSAYARMMRKGPPSGMGSQEALARNLSGEVSGLQITIHSEKISNRYASTPNGKTDRISKSYRLDWNGHCPTLRAGTGSEKGSFQAVRPLHPDFGRVITVREAARLQGFPDWFEFHPTKWHSFRMIGNSVSPFVSRAVMSAIAERMSLALAA
jgi:DNA (cytosine-5)-methyltransferase 1